MFKLFSSSIIHKSIINESRILFKRNLLTKPTKWSSDNTKPLSQFIGKELKEGEAIQLNKVQILSLLSSKDDCLIDSLLIHANSITESSFGNLIKPMGISFVSNVCERNCKHCLNRRENLDNQRFMMTNNNVVEDAQFMYGNNINQICLESGELNVRNRANWFCNIIKMIQEQCRIGDIPMSVYLRQGAVPREFIDIYKESGMTGYICGLENINEKRYEEYIVSGFLLGMKPQSLYKEVYGSIYKDLVTYKESTKQSIELDNYINKTIKQYITPSSFLEIEKEAEETINNDIYENISYLQKLNIKGINIDIYSPTRGTPCYSPLIYHDLDSYFSSMYIKLLKTVAILRCLYKDIDIYTSPFHNIRNDYGCYLVMLSGANCLFSLAGEQWTKQYNYFMDECPSPFPPADQLYIDKYHCTLAKKELDTSNML
ncbi:hypothetical protein WA158_002676 [Blastocystis sp. Blastoise]